MDTFRNIIVDFEKERIADKYYSEIVEAHVQAFAAVTATRDYIMESDFVDSYLNFKAHTLASLFHDFLRSKIKKVFEDNSNVIILDSDKSNGVFLIVLEGKVVIRFKKMRSQKYNYSISHVSTIRANQFLNQQNGIVGVPEQATLFYAGYIVSDNSFTKIISVPLICRKGEQIYWKRELNELYIQLSLFDMFDQEETVAQSSVVPSVRVKPRIAKEDSGTK